MSKRAKPKLPDRHPIRQLPDDLRLYRLVIEKLRTWKPHAWPDDNLDFTAWAYEQAREQNIPTECVSKVINLASLYPGGE